MTNTTTKGCPMDLVNLGERFTTNGKEYIKIDSCRNSAGAHVNSVNLTDGKPVYFSEKERVELI